MCKKDSAILFGGTFNPFTIAHLEIVKRLSKDYPNRDIIIMPSNLSFIRHWKKLPEEGSFSADDRVVLIEKATQGIERCFVSDEEASGRLSGRSFDTVIFLKESYEKVYICVGSDKLSEMPKWYHFGELMEQVSGIMVFDRGDSDSADFPHPVISMELNYAEVSSTLVRELYEAGRTEEIKALVPPAVYEYL